MINKTIHYCWFGRNPKPELALKCISSWKKHCPDYEIIEWNEDNFDVSACPLYVRQAYEMKKWPFVTDYVRLKVVYDHGGVYMDTDVELKKSLDSLLEYHAYFGFEDGKHIATGLGFGAEKGCVAVFDMMTDYDHIPFIEPDGSFDITPCPERNTSKLLLCGMKQDNRKQILDGNILILPSDYLCPIDYLSGKKKITSNTISIHWFAESWKSEQDKQLIKDIRKHKKLSWKITHFLIMQPKYWGRKIIGAERYEKIKAFLKRG